MLDNTSSDVPAKKQKRQKGSCDFCKRKKIKCDSALRVGGKCSNCQDAGLECTHHELAKNLGSAKPYVQQLEAQNERLTRMLEKLLPGVDLQQEDFSDIEIPSPQSTMPTAVDIPRNDDDHNVDDQEFDRTFLGKSSGYHLFCTAIDSGKVLNNTASSLHTFKRSYFWQPQSWQIHNPSRPYGRYHFPPRALLESLTILYFTHVNPFFPLLHRPTFERDLQAELHLTDPPFGTTVLLVAALGSRYTNDPRVFLDVNTPQSAGWKWFDQVTLVRSAMDQPTTVQELQHYALTAIYKPMICDFHSAWVEIGIALRLAINIGVHRRKKTTGPTSEYELLKRAFWVLLALDREMGAFLGRPSTITEADLDIEYPINCNDEFWDHPDPAKNFKQPPGVPCYMDYFLSVLELYGIQAHAMQEIYYVQRPKWRNPARAQSMQDTVSELNAALKAWFDSVPGHLRWDPNAGDGLFRRQSIELYVIYHNVQVFLHRPFIPTPSVSSALSVSALEICTKASRSCIQIASGVFASPSWIPQQHFHTAVCLAGVMLFHINFSRARSDPSGILESDVKAGQTGLDILARHEQRHLATGRLWDMLRETASAVLNHREGTNFTTRTKRPREELDSSVPDQYDAGSQSSASASSAQPSFSSSLSPLSHSSQSSRTSSDERQINQLVAFPPLHVPAVQQYEQQQWPPPAQATSAAQWNYHPTIFAPAWSDEFTDYSTNDWGGFIDDLTRGWPQGN